MNAIRRTERAHRPIVVASLAVVFIVGAILFASAPRAAAAPRDGESPSARSSPCRGSAAAAYRHRHWPCSPSAVRKPGGVAITAFGPGSLRAQGTPGALRLQVHDSTIAAVLATMRRAFNLQYRSSIALDDPITGTYAGSLAHVIARILDGYDYAITHEGPAVAVVVFGRSRGRAQPARPAPAAPAPAQHRYCGRSAGHQAACQSI